MQSVDVYAGLLENGEFVYKQFPLMRNQNYPKNKPQEQYGNWVNQQNQAIFFPIQFIITDRGGRTLKSPKYGNFSNGVPEYLDMGVQFPDVDYW